MTLDALQVESLRNAVLAAAGRRDVREAIGRIHRDLQVQVDERQPICISSGRCCRFEQFGHRLFITTLELAKFLHDWQTGAWPKEVLAGVRNWDATGCPFQVGKLCGVHSVRPFGCRIFFCDATAAKWQQDQYEQFHTKLRSLHESLKVPYFYVEWREGLRAMKTEGLAGC